MKKRMKKNKKAVVWFAVPLIIAAFIIIAVAGTMGTIWAKNKWFGDADVTASVTGEVIDVAACQWAGSSVKGELVSTAQFTGSAVNPTFKVWTEMPEGWGNPRESYTYDSDNPYKTYSSSAGVAVLTQDPGDAPLYVMGTLSNYATQFLEVTNGKTGIIPCESGTDSLSDYNSEPKERDVRLVGESALAITNVSLGFTANATDKEMTEYVYLSTDDEEGVAIWKVTFYDSLGIRNDADNDNTYDEGVKVIKLKIGNGKEVTIFDPANGITNEIDTSSGKYEYIVKEKDYTSDDFYMDGTSLPIKVFVKANVWYDSNSSATVGANDELLGIGETIGTLSILSSEATDLGDVYIKG